MEKVCPWCGQPSDRGRLKNRTEQLPQNLLDRSSLNLQGLMVVDERSEDSFLIPEGTLKCQVILWSIVHTIQL